MRNNSKKDIDTFDDDLWADLCEDMPMNTTAVSTLDNINPTDPIKSIASQDFCDTVELKRDLGRAEQICQDIDAVIQGYTERPLEHLHKVAISSEYLTRNLRQHAGGLSPNSTQNYMQDAARALDIVVVQDEKGVVKITMPSLLPKRKQRGAKFVAEPLREVLRIFIRDNPDFIRFDKCVICFTHVYGCKFGEKLKTEKAKIRDVDNIELKEIVDVINTYLLTDDSGKWCDMYHTSRLEPEDSTVIEIMHQSQFYDWMFRRQNLCRKTC